MNKIANRAVMCEVLSEKARENKDIVVLCSDSRGSGSMGPFAAEFPNQFVEVGIAEQNLVGISAGLASCGKRPFAVSPASFISTRSYEQAKVDCAYSDTNVKLIGISGGVSYGALGMTHHSAQDIAAMSAIPNMRVYFPSDRHQTRKLFEVLSEDNKTVYVRLGRNPVEDVYTEEDVPFEMNKATWVREGVDAALIACGEMVWHAKAAAEQLATEGIQCSVIDMYCLKPLDEQAIIQAARKSRLIVTIEEHAPIGGLGSMVAKVLAENCPTKMKALALPDEPVVSGNSKEIFAYYGLDHIGIAKTVRACLKQCDG